jgi:2-hydroxy-3-keto-5-methylthiopentenyl-1-phosphate phosphatase
MTRRGDSSIALFVDFDGTIVTTDTAQIALDRFGDRDWMRIDEALERGEVSFEESLKREYATLKAPPETIIKEVERVTALRPNFHRLVQYCESSLTRLKVVSGGLDFCIRHFLDQDSWLKFIEIHAPKSEFTGNGYTLTFPKTFASSSSDFKEDLVKREKGDGARVVFVGNGLGDFPAAKESDFAFAIKESRLAALCREQGVPHEEIDDFDRVVEVLRHRFH